jgi:cytochrome c-type biogenesis protein
MLDLSPDLQFAVETMGAGAAGIGFLAGLVFSINPVAVAAIPVSMAYVTKARSKREALRLGAFFVAGMIATHVALGLIAGLGGRWVSNLMGRGWGLALGPLLIVLGMIWSGWIKVPLPQLALRAKRPADSWGAFALGVPFSVGVCPFCTPALFVLVGLSGVLASPWIGAVLMFAFALGRSVPILLGAITVGWLEQLQALKGVPRLFDVTGGIILIGMGLYMLNAYFMLVPALAV